MTPVLFDVGVFLLVAGALIALIHHLAEPPELEEEGHPAPAAAPSAGASSAVACRRARGGRPVTLVFALAAGIVFGAGAFLVLTNDLVRVVAGMVLISQSAVLVVIASGLTRGDAPILPTGDKHPSDPLVQAMALTAIVIGLAVTALLLAIVARVRATLSSLEVRELARDEAEHTAEIERSLDAMHERLESDEAREEQ